MVAEVCSVYVLRADGVLELFATEGLKREAVHLRLAARRPGPRRHDRRGRAAAEPVRRAGPPGLPLPAGDRRGDLSNPSSACRSCAPATRSACWSCRTATPRAYHEEEVEALQTTAMVLAEMIAVGELASLTRPGTALDLTRPIRLTGIAAQRRRRPRPCGAARAARGGHRSPRRGRRRRRCARLDEAHRRAAAVRSTTCCRATTSPTPASIARCSKPTACSPMTAAGCGACTRRSATACRPRRRSRRCRATPAPACMRQTDPYLRDRLHDLDDLANRLLRVLTGKPHGDRRRANCPRTRSSSPATWAPADLLEYGRDASAAWCWRRAARPAMSPSSPARSACPPSARPTSRVAGRERRRHHRRRRRGRGPSAARRRRRGGLCRKGAASAPGGRNNIRRCATSRRSPATASR